MVTTDEGEKGAYAQAGRTGEQRALAGLGGCLESAGRLLADALLSRG